MKALADPRIVPLTMKIKPSDAEFIAQFMEQSGGTWTKSGVAYAIFECGRRYFFADRSSPDTNEVVASGDRE